MWRAIVDETEGQVRLPAVPELLARIRERMVASAIAVDAGRPPTYELAVAVDEAGEIVGLVSVRLSDGGPFVAPTAVVADLVHVTRPYRRHGVGKALLAEVAHFALAAGAEEVGIHVPTGARELNRFYAGWGFGPQTVRRTVPVAALRRRLGPAAGAGSADELGHLQRLLRRRAVLGRRVPGPSRSVR
jgi:GNAT superfamily N-acetyltransferase